jgi:hypothetical protein
MRAPVTAVVSYRFRAKLSRQWVGFAALVVLLGLLGGLSMAAVAAGRRTQSAFPAFFASTNPSDLQVATGLYNPQQGQTTGYVPSVVAGLARLPQVKRVESLAAVNLLPLTPAGEVPQGDGLSAGLLTASVDGELFDQDRLTVAAGRLPNPNRPNEIVVNGSNPSPRLLARLGLPGDSLRLGETLRLGVFTNIQASRPDFPSDSIKPIRVVSATIVGIGARQNTEVVRDDADTQGDSSTIVFTPALARQLLSCCVLNTYTGLQLKGGARDVPAVEREMSLLPNPIGVTVTAPLPATVINKAEEATKPESIALGAFGGIAGLATLVICAQAAGRQVRSGRRDAEVLRA